MRKPPKTSPSPWGYKSLIHQCLGQPLTTPNDSSITSCTVTQLCLNFPIGYDAPYLSPKLPLPMGISIPSSCLILRSNQPTTQTASRFNQLYFHNPPDRQTDRSTDGPGDKTFTNTHLSSVNDNDVTNNYIFSNRKVSFCT